MLRTRDKIAVLLSITVFQLWLCYTFDTVGISVIWNAQCGWSLLERQGSTTILTSVVYACTAAADIYYLVLEQTITTVAHVLALLLGLMLFTVVERIRRVRRPESASLLSSQEEPDTADNNHFDE